MSAVIVDNVIKSTVRNVQFPNVDAAELFKDVFIKFKDKVALVHCTTGVSLTFGELHETALRIAAGLQKLGLKPGQKVGIHSGNNLDCFLAVYGAIFAGGLLVFAPAHLTHHELRYLFGDSQPDFVFCDEKNASKGLEICSTLECVKKLIALGQYDGFISINELKSTSLEELQLVAKKRTDDTLMIIYSSGTTGMPKGILLTHGNFIAQMILSGFAGFNMVTPSDVMLSTNPCTHLSGIWIGGASLAAGTTVVLAPSSEPDVILPAIEKYKATTMLLFPTYALKLLQSPLLGKVDTSSLKTIVVGGSTAPAVVAQGVIEKLKLVSYMHMYGLTETTGPVTMSPRGQLDYISTGVPVAMSDMKVVDVHTGEKLGPLKEGEVCIRSPLCSPGYLNRPEATAALYDAEGFLRSGDIGYYDENGRFHIVDRQKEMIKCMDLAVSPAELEALLQQHAAVKEVAVAGVPHPEYVEGARAFVVLHKDSSHSVTEDELAKIISERLAPHKHLHGGVEFVKSIPKSDTGKFLRRALRDNYLKAKV
ncbi:uncharacterized protein LOC135378372 [Ornithodoros turicata]|uniref:uncharacterized protein LOC135378372 n=1 Tax=Ornithodoros turicata TaxID=34597 RepID=UPI003138A432